MEDIDLTTSIAIEMSADRPHMSLHLGQNLAKIVQELVNDHGWKVTRHSAGNYVKPETVELEGGKGGATLAQYNPHYGEIGSYWTQLDVGDYP